MKICYKKSPGPKETIDGKLITRSMIGNQNILNDGQ